MIHYGCLNEIWALQMMPVPDLDLYCCDNITFLLFFLLFQQSPLPPVAPTTAL